MNSATGLPYHRTLAKFRYLNIIALCLIIATNGLVGCNRTTPSQKVTPTAAFTPTVAIPTAERIVIHPELEAIAPDNIDRLEQIDQWGQGVQKGQK